MKTSVDEREWLPDAADMEWMTRGACVGVDLPWTGDDNRLHPSLTDQMRQTCGSCPVLRECAIFASQAGVTGGWWAGGTPTYARRLGRHYLLQDQEDHAA